MERSYTSDFGITISEVLVEYSGKELRLMIAGGSILTFFSSSRVSAFDTKRWSIYYSDERFGSEDLNYTTSLSFVKSIEANVFPIQPSDTPEFSAEEYSRICKYVDLAILGIGEDGHIASLFPNSSALNSKKHFVPVYNSPKPPPVRITATLEFFNKCVGRLIFLIPPKNGQLKDVMEPHQSIRSGLCRKYTVYVDSQKGLERAQS